MKNKYFNVFILMLLTLFSSIITVSAFPDGNIQTYIISTFQDKSVLFNVSDGIINDYNDIHFRNSRINFSPNSNISRILPSLINDDEMIQQSTTDYDLDGNQQTSWSVSDTESDFQFDMDISIDLTDETSSISMVIDINNYLGVDVIVKIGFVSGSDLWVRLHNIADILYLQLYNMGSALDDYTIDITSQIDISIPIYLGMDIREEYSSIYYGNVNSVDNIYSYDWVHDNYVNPSNHDNVRVVFEEGIELIAFDFNQNYQFDEYGFEVDETYYTFRCLNFYSVLDESYNLFDNPDDSIVDWEEIDTFRVAPFHEFVRTNLTNNLDYKLNDDFSNKVGIYGWNDANTTEWDGVITYEEVDNHENVFKGNDDSASDSTGLTIDIPDSITGSIEYWMEVSTIAITKTYYFYGETEDSDIAMYVRLDNANIEYYNGGYIDTGYDYYNNGWMHFRMDWDCVSDTYTMYLNNVIIALDIPFHSLASVITGLRIITNTVHQSYWFALDSIGVSAYDYPEQTNKYVGLEENTKLVSTMELRNETDVSDVSMEFTDIFYSNISYKLEPPWSDDPYYATNENPYSAFGIIFSSPIDSDGGDGAVKIRLKFPTKFYTDRTESEVEIYMNDGSWVLTPTIYDLDNNFVYNYIASYGDYLGGGAGQLYPRDNDITDLSDGRLGLIVQRNQNFGETITLFNSTDIIVSWYLDEAGITFASCMSVYQDTEYERKSISVEVQNYYSLGTPKRSDGVKIYGLIVDENASQTYTMEMLKGYFDSRMYNVNLTIFDVIDVNKPNFGVSGYSSYHIDSFLSYYNLENITNGIFNPNFDFINVSVSSSTNQSLESLILDKQLYNSLYLDYDLSEFYDKKIYTEYNCQFSRPLDYSFAINNTIRTYWVVYVSTNPVNIIDQLMEVGAQLLIIGVFPYAFYSMWKKKGAIIGFVVGFLILTFSGLLSLTYAVILVPLALVVSYFTVFKKGVSSDDI